MKSPIFLTAPPGAIATSPGDDSLATKMSPEEPTAADTGTVSGVSYAPGMAVDTKPATMWHTPWTPTITPLPHTLTLDLGSVQWWTVGLRYLPRQDGAPNGTATVLLGGQTPLVIGAQQYTIQASFAPAGSPVIPNATPDARILDSSGQDITAHITQGSLGGLLNVRNTVLPSLQGDGQQQGACEHRAARSGGSNREYMG